MRAPFRPTEPSFVELFTPKLATVLREGYGGRRNCARTRWPGLPWRSSPCRCRLPSPSPRAPRRRKAWSTAIVGGFLVSALGGSRFQVGGPAGAFIVLVSATVAAHGIDGLILAVLMSGFMLAAMGFLRLGAYIKFVPYPVTVGFTAGVAIIIFASQIKELFGLSLAAPEPGALAEKLGVLWDAAPSMNFASAVIAALTIATILVLKRLRPHWPGLLIAVCGATLAAALLGLPIDTIGSRFGALPHFLPAPRLAGLQSPARARVCCPARSPSRCWARSNRCSRRWSPTA